MIRRMINGELQDVLALVKHVFMEFEAPDYSAERGTVIFKVS